MAWRTTRTDKVIFFEGARITLEAHMVEYPPSATTRSARVLTMGDPGDSTGSSCLTSSTGHVEKHIKLRNRPTRSPKTWCAGSG
jgi:hypothetical protein